MRSLFLFLLFTACACKPSIRYINLCALYPSEGKASCAKADKKYNLKFPSQLNGWVAFHEMSFELLAARLEECEQRGSLPKGDTTWEEMNTCIISSSGCGGASFEDLEYHFAVDASGSGKIKARLQYCTR